jgi:cell division cycle protein 37
MLLDLLLRVRTAAVNSADGDKVDVSKLVEQLEFHEKELDNRSEECEKQAHAEEMEQKKKITSEDVHEGFDVGVSKRWRAVGDGLCRILKSLVIFISMY